MIGAVTRDRLHLLDGLRGIAALLVVLYHLGQLLAPDSPPVPGGYLAVDLFFLLSGLVIAGAYEERLRAGMGLRRFLTVRLVRLYPLYLLGLLVGVAAAAFGLVTEPSAQVQEVVATLSNLVMLPAAAGAFLFPFNPPAWSLFFEVVANLAYARAGHRWTTKVLFAIVALAGLALAGAGTAHSLDHGWGWSTIWIGAVRTVFSFTLGVVLSRLGVGQRRVTSSWRWLLPALTVPALLTLSVPTGWRGVVDAAAVLAVFPALIVAAASIEPPAWLRRPCAWAGDLSYPLYAIHYPVLLVAVALSPTLAGSALRWVVAGSFAGALSIAAMKADARVCRSLNAALRRPPSLLYVS